MFKRLPISIAPLNTEIAETAARLRAQHPGARLPDGIVIATAVVGTADQLLTTDPRWPSAKAMKLKLVITQV